MELFEIDRKKFRKDQCGPDYFDCHFHAHWAIMYSVVFEPLGAGSSVLDLEDFLVSNILLPLGSLVYLLFATWDIGLGL